MMNFVFGVIYTFLHNYKIVGLMMGVKKGATYETINPQSLPCVDDVSDRKYRQESQRSHHSEFIEW